ncbi:MAG: radical SAM family heme chaperone HemW [Bacteroidota bacterium]|nr:radical SAM family heme chaperone HemW [Bacteroidota bacterium]
MAGIYIHIPFCKQACHYCNFHFSTNHKLMPQMLAAIGKEAEWRKDYLNEKVETIYFGGGTPSLLAIHDLRLMIEKLKELFIVADDAEITLEANPDDITEEKLIDWKHIGINRLSIGIQSFSDVDLQWMNRAHNAQHAINCLQLATKYFNNITIDLIYGSPTLTDEQWKKNVELAVSFNIPHISCYALTVEPKTALDKLIVQQKKENVDADKLAKHFELLVQWMKEAGYEHYEISNFAKPNYRSKHNSSYWKGLPYLGLGPSAHSFNGTSRQWNIANNALYIQSIEKGELNFEKEELTASQQLNEYIMTSLRTIEGINFNDERWLITDDEAKNKIILSAKKWEALGNIILNETFLRLTDKGKFLADGIAADLFQL